jgi:uncharacterized protein (TIGR02246 family)
MDVSPETEVRQLLADLLAAWSTGRFDDLHRVFRDDVVFVLPGFEQSISGRQAAVASYADFMHRVRMIECREDVLSVSHWDAAATAVTRWHLIWDTAGRRFDERGHDIYTLVRSPIGWHVTWRAIVPATSLTG